MARWAHVLYVTLSSPLAAPASESGSPDLRRSRSHCLKSRLQALTVAAGPSLDPPSSSGLRPQLANGSGLNVQRLAYELDNRCSGPSLKWMAPPMYSGPQSLLPTAALPAETVLSERHGNSVDSHTRPKVVTVGLLAAAGLVTTLRPPFPGRLRSRSRCKAGARQLPGMSLRGRPKRYRLMAF